VVLISYSTYSTYAIIYGRVTDDGNSPLTQMGACWALTANPTTGDTITTLTGNTDHFITIMTGLSPSTTYNVRTYAINTAGYDGYSSNISFTTKSAETIPTVLILGALP
jgi:hypothetical protein